MEVKDVELLKDLQRKCVCLIAAVSAVIAAHSDAVTNATGRMSAGRSGSALVAQGPLWRETWKDPLSEEEMKGLMEMHGRYEREKGAESKKAHEPTDARGYGCQGRGSESNERDHLTRKRRGC